MTTRDEVAAALAAKGNDWLDFKHRQWTRENIARNRNAMFPYESTKWSMSP